MMGQPKTRQSASLSASVLGQIIFEHCCISKMIEIKIIARRVSHEPIYG